MKVTVAICTWNRAELLDQTLEAMTHLHIPPATDWELLVVNNNCTDHTDQVIALYEDRLPLRRLWEPKPGQSNARNLATREACGAYILWTDDDVQVDPDWLAAYCRAFGRHPSAAIFAGRIDPWFAGAVPSWLPPVFARIATAYAALDLGEEELSLGGKRLPFGANMAIRTAEQRRHPYDPSLGLKPNGSLRGEETTMARSLFAAGGEGWWVPQARVKHYIPPERQTVRYLRGYYFGYGQVFARECENASVKWFGRPRWLWRQALQRELCYRFRRLLGRPTVWIEDLMHASIAWGMLREWKNRCAIQGETTGQPMMRTANASSP